LEIAYLNQNFLHKIQKKIKEIINTGEKEVVIHFLKGIFAGDGFVKLRNNGKLQEVRIGAVHKKEKEEVCKLLKIVGIHPGKPQKLDIPIYGKINFEKIKRLCLFEVSQDKLNKFLKGFEALCNGE
jgi:hypothetical protein